MFVIIVSYTCHVHVYIHVYAITFYNVIAALISFVPYNNTPAKCKLLAPAFL